MKHTKKLCSLLLAVIMVLGIMQVAALADHNGSIIVSLEKYDTLTGTITQLAEPKLIAITTGDTGMSILKALLGEENITAPGGFITDLTIGGTKYAGSDMGDYGSWALYKNGEPDNVGISDYIPQNGDDYRIVLTTYDPNTYMFPDLPLNDKITAIQIAESDIKAGTWYYDGMVYAVTNGIMTGVGGGKYNPTGSLSRGMLVTMLYRIEGTPAVSGESRFSDVAAGKWYTEAVIWANENGIVTGMADGTFAPDADITREQLATILYRYAKYRGSDVSVGEDTNILSYEDALTISEYAIPAIQWACGAGVMSGTTAKGSDALTISPKGTATRAQVAVMLERMVHC